MAKKSKTQDPVLDIFKMWTDSVPESITIEDAEGKEYTFETTGRLNGRLEMLIARGVRDAVSSDPALGAAFADLKGKDARAIMAGLVNHATEPAFEALIDVVFSRALGDVLAAAQKSANSAGQALDLFKISEVIRALAPFFVLSFSSVRDLMAMATSTLENLPAKA